MNKINKRIPGILPPPPKTEIDGKITDLAAKTISELLELRDRQKKLISNPAFLKKLADKGEKIKVFYDKILDNIQAKEEEEKACRLFSSLNLNTVDKETVQNVEWEGRVTEKRDLVLDSDDDSEPEDVLHILSHSTAQEKTIKVIPPEKPLVTAKDLLIIDELPHVKYLVDMTEVNHKPKLGQAGQFKPYKTTKSDVHNPEKEMARKRGKHWEVTAATPPPSIHGPAKVLPLQESLKLQRDHNLHLKEVEARHAAEKLIARTGIKMAELPQDTVKFGDYRDVESESDTSDAEGSDKEVHDEEPERGGVVFTIMK